MEKAAIHNHFRTARIKAEREGIAAPTFCNFFQSKHLQGQPFEGVIA